MHSNQLPERHAKWQALIEAQSKSGQSQKEFCLQHKLVLSQFTYYRGLMKPKSSAAVAESRLFAPVQIKKSEIKSLDEIRILLPNGFQCLVSSQMMPLQIKQLVEVLLSC